MVSSPLKKATHSTLLFPYPKQTISPSSRYAAPPLYLSLLHATVPVTLLQGSGDISNISGKSILQQTEGKHRMSLSNKYEACQRWSWELGLRRAGPASVPARGIVSRAQCFFNHTHKNTNSHTSDKDNYNGIHASILCLVQLAITFAF